MSQYRTNLPQLANKLFLTDGGMETTFVFHQNIELPCFASFDLLKSREGETVLRNYYRKYAKIACNNGMGFILESPTWRASSAWGKQMGYSDIALEAINSQAIELMVEIRDEFENESSPMVISGCLGPADDGYNPSAFMTIEQAQDYHAVQVKTFANTRADMVSAFTLCYVEEAIGITLAAQSADIPVVISFTLETDGCLPSGQTLQSAIEMVDEKTMNGPAYYMINCAHPTHFNKTLQGDHAWLKRIGGIQANASCKSHAELDECTELDDGNPVEFGQQYREFKSHLHHLNVLGGCCGTDHRHIQQICQSVLAA